MTFHAITEAYCPHRTREQHLESIVLQCILYGTASPITQMYMDTAQHAGVPLALINDAQKQGRPVSESPVATFQDAIDLMRQTYVPVA